MAIRTATVNDILEIQTLLKQLGYNKSEDFFKAKLSEMLSQNNVYEVLVYQLHNKIVGLITMHYYLQIGFEGETANIGFFVVDENIRSKGVGKEMEEYCTLLAQKRNCEFIELFSSEKRTNAHRFYARQGYKQYNKFFIKEIGDNI